MTGGRDWWRGAYVAATVSAGLALVVACAAVGVLTWRYQPGGAFAGAGPGDVRWSDRLRDVVDGALVVAAILLVGWALLVARRGGGGRRPSPARHAVVLTAAFVAVGATLVALQLTDVVRWDHVVVRPTGNEVKGLWSAAFRDDVRFVVAGPDQYEPASYARFVVAQLAAPFVALGALAVGWAASRRP